MKILLFQLFAPTIWSRGGGETYLARVREELVRTGVDAQFLNLEAPQSDFDLLHVFGSNHEVADFVATVAAMQKPVVVSPICLSNKPWIAWKAAQCIDRVVPFPTLYGYRKQVYDCSARLFPSSRVMARQLHHYFGTSYGKMSVIHLGADERVAQSGQKPFVDTFGMNNFVLEVARVNSRKGQARLIRALRGTGIPIVFIGPLDPSDPQGTSEFLKLTKENSNQCCYLGPLYDQKLLYSAYHAAHVHALPSIGEFPGLTNLEAALGGANLVVGTAPEVKEYFGDAVTYCEPTSIADIRSAVLKAWKSPKQDGVRELVLREFTWRRTTQALVAEYRKVMAMV